MSTDTGEDDTYSPDQGPEQYLASDIDDLDDEDLELLWVVNQHPGATLEEIGEAYGFATGNPIGSDLQDLLDVPNKARGVVQELFEDDGPFSDYEPDEWTQEIVEDVAEIREQDESDEDVVEEENQEGSDEQEDVDTDIEESYKCEDCGDEFDSERARSIHVTRAHEMTYTDAQIETLQAILKHPGKDQRGLSEILDISKSGVEYRMEAIREEYGDFDWSNRIQIAEEILEDEDVEIPDVVDEDGQSFECQNCGREFDSRSSLGSHERFCDGSLTDRQREALEAVRDNPEKNQGEIAEMLDISNSSLSAVFNDQLEYPWGQRLEAVDEYLDDDDQDESDDVEMQDVPTDRDLEQADEAVEGVLDEGDGEGTPHVKNEDQVSVDASLLVDEDNVIGIGRVEHGDDSAEVQVSAEKLKQALDLAGQDNVVLRVADDYPLLITGERGSNLGVGVAPMLGE